MAIRDFGGDFMNVHSDAYFTGEEIREFADAVCEKTKDYILKYIDMDIDDYAPTVVDTWCTPISSGSDRVSVTLEDGEYTVIEEIVLPFARWKSPKIPQKYIDKLADQLARAFGDELWLDMDDVTSDWGR